MKYLLGELDRLLRRKVEKKLKAQGTRIFLLEFESLYQSEVDKFAKKLFLLVEQQNNRKGGNDGGR